MEALRSVEIQASSDLEAVSDGWYGHQGVSSYSESLLMLLRALLEVVADDFALYRQPDIAAICNTTELHQLETKAKAAGLFYHKTKSGNIAAYGYGAGVAMSTMDALSVAGGKVGGHHNFC